MKTKKVVIGTMAAAIFSMSLCALPVTFAAGETVQISVGSKEVAPGDTFTVDVMLTDIPQTGIQACDFSIQFDKSLIKVTSVEAGALTKTGADAADSTSAFAPAFASYFVDGGNAVNVAWSTSLDDSKYWLNGTGVLCTITAEASASAPNGTKTEIKLAPTGRETYPDSGATNSLITVGYSKGSDTVRYDVTKTNGVITIGVEPTTAAPTAAPTTAAPATPAPTQAPTAAPTTAPATPAPGTEGKVVYGDADCDGKVTINDAVAIMSYMSNRSMYPLKPEGINNADVASRGDGVSNIDALAIQKWLAGIIEKLPES